MILVLKDIKKSFGENLLFDNITFEIEDGDKIGLVGVNGVGKTSLFKIITGEMVRDGGEIYKNNLVKIGYVEQHACHDSDKTIYEQVLAIFQPLMNIEDELESIHENIENRIGDIDKLIKRQHTLTEQYEALGGHLYKSRVRAMLLGLGFTQKEFNMPVKVLSGGQKTKIQLGRLLLGEADLLLLDEPTNHLDIKSVEWLEDFLKNYIGAYIVISHDRYFLDRVTKRTFELENQKLTTYKGNYSYYLQKKNVDREILTRQYQNTQKEIQRIEGIIEQQRKWNRERNIKTAESKQKVVDRLEKTLVKPDSSPSSIGFSFSKKIRGGNDVLIIEDLKKSFQDKELFKEINLHIKKGERIFLLGPNGCGKTTLFKIIMGQYESDIGSCKIGVNIEVGYYDQTQTDLDYSKTVFEEVYDSYPTMTQTDIRNALAAFLFKDESVFKQISTLSGGERARVSLLKLMLSQTNFLLLDEPTNHLDIRSREELEQAFENYDGTLFIVSHDRYFINKMADKIMYLHPTGIKEYLGNYDYYLENHEIPNRIAEVERPKKNDYLQKKENEAAERRILGQISRTEREISALEDQVNQLENELIQPQIVSDHVKTLEIYNKIHEIQQSMEDKYEAWDTLQQSLNK